MAIKKPRNWRTTVGSLVTVLGYSLATQVANPTVKTVGDALVALGLLITGASAADSKLL